MTHALDVLEKRIVSCRKCPELRQYCAEIGKEKRRAFADWNYWAKPVPAFGDPDASIFIVGLAPAAHGANRTGRMFTGDRSGDFLYAALHHAGLASQPDATHREDGLRLRDVYITAAVRCAPPANKPTTEQKERCLPHLVEEICAMKPRVMICLGSIAWDATLNALRESGEAIPRPRPKFGHGAEAIIGGAHVLGCYHVSQQNTFTGKLTQPMLADVLTRATELAGL